MSERWLPVVGYEKTHLVSDLGKVKAKERTWEMPNGGSRSKPESVLAQIKNRFGYLKVNLHNSGVRKVTSVSRIVALAFIPNPENKPEVNHKNGIKTDNRVENLEWCTRSENNQHAYDTGLNPKRYGINNANHKIHKTNFLLKAVNQ